MPDPVVLEKLGLSRFIALDLETTGLQASKDQIIEFGATLFVDGEASDEFGSLIRPTIPIPDLITSITGISDEDVKDAPPIEDVMPEIIEFCGDLPLVAHNAGFDMAFLRRWAAVVDAEGVGVSKTKVSYFKNDVFDTVFLARTFFWWVNNHRLDTLAEYLKLDREEAHRASADAARAGELFLRILPVMLRSDYGTLKLLHRLLAPTNLPSKELFRRVVELLDSSGLKPGDGLLPPEAPPMRQNVLGQVVPVQFDAAPEVRYIEAEEIESTFSSEGKLASRLPGYEARPQQKEMAIEVAEALNHGYVLVVEAGTGVGKSLAYLVPSLFWGIANRSANQKVVIATRTKNLQEQLFFKDIPLLHETLGIRFKAVLLKGKNNYICESQWHSVLSDPDGKLTPEERISITPVITWMNHTQTGDIEENNGFRPHNAPALWSKISSQSGVCTRSRCRKYFGCFSGRVRESAMTADLVVINHSLLLADVASDKKVLSEYQNLVIDEAHNLEKGAWQFLGKELSIWKIRTVLSRFHDRNTTAGGILDMAALLLETFWQKLERTESAKRKVKQVINQVVVTTALTEELFSALNKEPEWASKSRGGYIQKIRYTEGGEFFIVVAHYIDKFLLASRKLRVELSSLMDIFRDFPTEGKEEAESVVFDLLNAFEALEDVMTTSEMMFSTTDPSYVYWIELPNRNEGMDVRMFAVPLDIAEILYETLYSELRTVVFTSATLAADSSFDYFQQRIGLKLLDGDRLKLKEVGSPFNYDEQVTVAVASFLPPPEGEEFIQQASKLLLTLAEKFRKGTLALFTSYNMMNRFYKAIEYEYKDSKLLLLGQGKDGSRYTLQERFKSVTDSTLMGTESFWEGIDIRGNSLEHLVIAKLPFAVPTEPMIKAIQERLEAEGRNSFSSYVLPEAVIKFRQGFGRLIRSTEDTGVVIILDNRVVKKQYGRHFLNSLPTEARSFTSSEGLIEWLSNRL